MPDDTTRWATAPMTIDALRSEVRELRAFRDAVKAALGHSPTRDLSNNTELLAQLGESLSFDNGQQLADLGSALSRTQHQLDTADAALRARDAAHSDLMHRLTLLANEFDSASGRHAGPDGSEGQRLSMAWEIAARSLRNVLGVP